MSSGRPEPDQPLYTISVAAELAGIPARTIRLYEHHGLLTPQRTEGGTRRYSDNDIARLRRATELAAGGINLAGIRHVLDLQDENTRLRKSQTSDGE